MEKKTKSIIAVSAAVVVTVAAVGIINATRDEDGIIRNVTPIFKYQGKLRPCENTGKFKIFLKA